MSSDSTVETWSKCNDRCDYKYKSDYSNTGFLLCKTECNIAYEIHNSRENMNDMIKKLEDHIDKKFDKLGKTKLK